RAAVAVARGAEQVGVDLVQARLGHRAAIAIDAPLALVLAHDDVGHDVGGRRLVIAAAGAGVERADDVAGLPQFARLATGRALQGLVIVARQDIEVFVDNALRQRDTRPRAAGHGLQ